MKEILLEPLTADAFRPFGDVLEAPAAPGRTYFDAGLKNGRPGARASLSLAHVQPFTGRSLDAVKMERHEFSSQSFLPLDGARYLVVVAPHGADGRPDTTRARAFLARGDQGVTYGMNVWHHPLTVLDRPARFAISMWLERKETDEEFVDLAIPFRITLPVA